MANDPRPLEFPVSALPDTLLAATDRVAASWLQHAPALSLSVGAITRAEIERRLLNRRGTGSPIPPGEFSIGFDGWADAEVADALLLLHAFSTTLNDPQFAELVDALLAVVTAEAADRLRNSADPRNATGFLERHIRPEALDELRNDGGQHDPEQN